MTTLELRGFADEHPMANGLFSGFLRVVASVRRWRNRRETLVRLSHLDERLLGDVGLVPLDIYDPFRERDALLRDVLDARPGTR